MNYIKHLLNRVIYFFHRDRFDRELEEELLSHLEMKVAAKLEDGESPVEAHYSASRELGNQTRIREESREIWGFPRFETLTRDIAFSLRTLWKQPGFTIVALVVLGVGIGASTTVFSIVNTVLLHPLSYHDPDRLVLIQESLPKLGFSLDSVSGAELLEYQAQNRVFSQTAGFSAIKMNLTGAGEPQRVETARVGSDLFSILDVKPILGRTFRPEEDRPGGDRVVILSEHLWRNRFGADPSITGKAVNLDDHTFTVAGVMPANVQFPFTGKAFTSAVDLWIPLALTSAEQSGWADSFDFGVIARLKSGVSVETARADVKTIAARFQAEHRDVYEGNIELIADVITVAERIVTGIRRLCF